MSNATKKQISGAGCVLSVVSMTFCIGQMIPPGLSGDIEKVKPHFILLFIALIFGLVFGAAYSYYRGNPTKDEELERMRVEMNTLSFVGAQKKTKELTQANPTELSQPDTESTKSKQ